MMPGGVTFRQCDLLGIGAGNSRGCCSIQPTVNLGPANAGLSFSRDRRRVELTRKLMKMSLG